VKAYLESFTVEHRDAAHAGRARRLPHAPGLRRRGSSDKPVLVGVSEARACRCSPQRRHHEGLLGGVVALGLPDVNELGWRWKDALIYVTHGVPKEPTVPDARRRWRAVAPLPSGGHPLHQRRVRAR
jgi:hypothetical protein